MEEQFIAAYGGLRGAVAFSLVNMLDESLGPRRIFVTTTLVVILFTIFIQVGVLLEIRCKVMYNKSHLYSKYCKETQFFFFFYLNFLFHFPSPKGTTIKPLVSLLHIQRASCGRKNLGEEINDTTMDHIMAGVEEILGQHGDFYLRVRAHA